MKRETTRETNKGNDNYDDDYNLYE
uniref:Uncharacterized protein n=1 Tax=Romanomermis culicivorax TaxID=13658 RepID=A0A915HNV3_ROMCU